MLNRYKNYLEYLDYKLRNMFNEQSEFIKCSIGCDLCCKNGEYPMSELEYAYVISFYSILQDNIKIAISNNIINLLEQKFAKYYECPFLIKGVCAVYEARPLICRTFGLISYTKNNKKQIPFCVDHGLNYSNVYNKEKSIIDIPTDSVNEPKAYNVNRTFLRSKKVEEKFNIYFGEDKSMIEWLREDVKP